MRGALPANAALALLGAYLTQLVSVGELESLLGRRSRYLRRWSRMRTDPGLPV